MSEPVDSLDASSLNRDGLRAWVAAWAGRVPQLARVSPAHWRGTEVGGVSYPSSGHATLARIEADSYWYNHRNDVISTIVKRLPPDGPMFDVGGGNGYVGLGLRDVNVAVIVVEPGAQGVAAALDRGFLVIEAAFHRLDIPADSLPAVGLFDVLEHIEDDEGALATLYASIEPGGTLYVSVPAHAALWSAEDEFAGHYRRYSLPHLERIITAAGFSVEYSTCFFSLLTVPVFLMRSIPSRLGAKSKMNDPEAVEREHTMPKGVLGGLFRRSFSRELAKIGSGGMVRTGTSCLVAARKPSTSA